MVGLPVASMRHPASVAALEARLTGTHDVGGSTVTVGAVKVLAQPKGALLYLAQSQQRTKTMLLQKNLVIDPGHRTFDWIYTQSLQQIDRKSHSLPRGMFDVLKDIADAISRHAGTQYRDLEAIDAALRGGARPVVFQKEYDIGRHLALAR